MRIMKVRTCTQIPTQLTKHVDEISLRRFTSYTLIDRCLVTCPEVNNNKIEEWYEYSVMNSENLRNRVLIRHPQYTFTPAQLCGFNNTGNICIWPSEETLAYYALSNGHLFNNRTVLELGGGMSCLAGLMIAFHLYPKSVHLTDGNALAIDNVYHSIRKNLQLNTPHSPIGCSVLKWDRNETGDFPDYDVIICADCLFFDEYRLDLIETIWNRLSKEGVAFAMAPSRGNTLQEFLIEAKFKGFNVTKMYYYDKRIWDRHVSLLDDPDYNEDIHYPILLQLSKMQE